MGPKRKYTGRFRPLEEGGEAVLVPVLTHPEGRWHEEFRLRSNAIALEVVERLLRDVGLTLDGEGHDKTWRLEGFVVMSCWHLQKALGTVFAEQDKNAISAQQVLHNLLLQQCKQGVRAVIEFPVLAASCLANPIEVELGSVVNMNNYSECLDKPSFANALWSKVPLEAEVVVTRDNGQHETISLDKLWREWSSRFQWHVPRQSVSAGWRVWRPLGQLMCRHKWNLDGVAVTSRATGRYAVRLRTDAPAAKLVREYLDMKVRNCMHVVNSLALFTFTHWVECEGIVKTRSALFGGERDALRNTAMKQEPDASLHAERKYFVTLASTVFLEECICPAELSDANEFPVVAIAPGAHADSACVVPAAVSSSSTQPVAVRGCVKRWPARHLIRAVIATAGDKQLGQFEQSLKRKLDFLFHENAAPMWEELKKNGFSVPDRHSIARARVQLDIAAIGHARDVNYCRDAVWRQLNFD
eukprot:2447487-Amphidinium_carterae.2